MDKLITLDKNEINDITGRAFVVHAGEDDLGMGGKKNLGGGQFFSTYGKLETDTQTLRHRDAKMPGCRDQADGEPSGLHQCLSTWE